MSNPPVIGEPFYEFDVTFADSSTTSIYMTGSNSDTSALATLMYNAIKANSNVSEITQNLWGEDQLSSFTAEVEVAPARITYNPNP